jgi:hypothetical protein
MKDIELPASKTLMLKILENNYLVTFPLVGQFIEIQTLKQSISRGQYDALSASYSSNDDTARKYIDMITLFTVLIPKLQKDLNTPSLFELDIITMETIYHEVYLEQFLPWYNEWMLAISKVTDKYYEMKAGSAKPAQ